MTVFSKFTMTDAAVRQALREHTRAWPPAIPFESTISKKTSAKKSNKSKDADGDDTDDLSGFRSFTIPFDPTNPDSGSYKTKVRVFEEGNAEEFVTWRQEIDDLFEKLQIDEISSSEAKSNEHANKRHMYFSSLLKGDAKEHYRVAWSARHAENNTLAPPDRASDSIILDFVLNDLAKFYFGRNGEWKTAYRVQKSYLRKHLYMGDMSPDKFIDRVLKLNRMLAYFPYDDTDLCAPASLEEDEIIDILDSAKKLEWHAKMLEMGRAPHSFNDVEEARAFYNNLYSADSFRKRSGLAGAPAGSEKTKKVPGAEAGRPGGSNGRKRKKPAVKDGPACTHCGKSHDSDTCWTLAKNKDKRPEWFKSGSTTKRPKFDKLEKTERSFTTEELNAIVNHAVRGVHKATKARYNKRQRILDSDEEDEELNAAVREAVLDSDENSDADEYAYPLSLNRPAKKSKPSHYTGEILVEIEDRNGTLVPIRALLDTGTTSTIVLRQFVRKGRAKGYKGKRTVWNTLGGQFSTNRKALVEFKFPELSNDKKVTWVCHVDDKTDPKTASYDIIIGMDLMTDVGIYIDTKDKVIRWEEAETPLKDKATLADPVVRNQLYHAATAPDILQDAESRQSRILDADYSAVDINEHVGGLDHLSSAEKEQLTEMLKRHPKLFGGGLGTLNIKPIHLELTENAKPYHARAFPVPQSLEATTKKEMARLTDIKVFEKCHDSEWAAPTFVQPKKTGDVRILTDFRELNKYIKRKPFPLPKISDLLQKLSGFKYATAIDLSMGYYHIPLDEESSRLCTTILPWGKYRYLRLPMGIKNSPDIFQAIMMDLMGDLDFARTYLDDILVTSNGTFEDHLRQVEKVLKRLEQAGFRANVRKCFFGNQELEYLGYWLTTKGIQPQPKKVEAILRLKPPKTKRQLRHFLGMVNYYRDMWRRRSHLLTPLTGLVGKDAKFVWGKEQQQAFDEMKKVISKETLLTFPDFNKEFHIYTDASNVQLGAVIMQEGKPLAFYSRKMNAAQRRYTTGEQELLSIVETLKEYRNILLGQNLVVYTDHKNIIYGNLSNDRIARWRLLLEEFGPRYEHIAGKDNVVADALSRMEADFSERKEVSNDAKGQIYACALVRTGEIDQSYQLPDANDAEAVAEQIMPRGETVSEKFPLSPELLHKEQRSDRYIQKDLKEKPREFGYRVVEGHKLVTREDKIVVPRRLQGRVVAWYHEYLVHPGETRLEKTLRQTLYWKGLRGHVEGYVKTCRQCQLNKKQRKKYGHLPAKEAEPSEPWNRVNVDLIGPYTVRSPSGQSRELRAITMIDPATGWFEVTDIPEPTADVCMKAFDDSWLSRYPRPQYIGYDNGSEFKNVFRQMVQNYGIKPKPSSSHNPQANGIVERVHQVLGNALRTFELEERELDSQDTWKSFLAAAAFSIRSTYHTTLEATPAQLVFGRDMLLPVKFQADWTRIKQKRQTEINRNNDRENKNRIPHQYQPGDKVLLTKPGIQRKMSAPRTGPHNVESVYTNGTVRIRRGAVSERVNIRRLTPYFE